MNPRLDWDDEITEVRIVDNTKYSSVQVKTANTDDKYEVLVMYMPTKTPINKPDIVGLHVLAGYAVVQEAIDASKKLSNLLEGKPKTVTFDPAKSGSERTVSRRFSAKGINTSNIPKEFL